MINKTIFGEMSYVECIEFQANITREIKISVILSGQTVTFDLQATWVYFRAGTFSSAPLLLDFF